MRLWSLHPAHLDAKGLVALWREALLAQKVLQGATRGYRHHPQLQRFRQQTHPVAALATYLQAVHAEAERRGYRFDGGKIAAGAEVATRIPVTRGQLAYEWAHLAAKLSQRAPADHARLLAAPEPQVHPLFVTVEGAVESWERP